MFSERNATVHKIVAKVIARPEFVGSLHDTAMARSLGYPAALVPGIDLYAYLSRLTLETWGPDWFRRGALASTSLRPVYDGDALVVYAEPVQHRAGTRSVELAVHNEAGTMVASACASLSDADPPVPDLADFPSFERRSPVPPGEAGMLEVGMTFSSLAETLDADDNRQRVTEFLDTSPIYTTASIVHPAYLQRMALKNAHASFAHPTPPIYITAECRNYSPALVGERIDVAGRITRLWERKGHHYMESDQLVTANGDRAVMLIRRTTIYQARREAASTTNEARP